MVLRDGAEGDPAEKGRSPGGEERSSSQWTQIAKQNCTAGEPALPDFNEPIDEFVICWVWVH